MGRLEQQTNPEFFAAAHDEDVNTVHSSATSMYICLCNLIQSSSAIHFTVDVYTFSVFVEVIVDDL